MNAQQFDFQNYSVADGLAQSQVYAMINDSQGYIWMGTQGGGLSRFDGINFTSFTVRDSLSNNYVESLFEDKEGNIWVGTQSGLNKFDGLNFQTISDTDTLFITAIAQDLSGFLWVGTRQGIYQYDGKQLTNYSRKNKLSRGRVNCFFYDKKNTLWIGMSYGAYQVVDGKPNLFTKQSGLLANSVKAITQDKLGNIWLGTFSGGLQVFDGENFTNYQENNGLPSNLILSLHKAADNKIWISSQDKGLGIWNPADSSFSSLTIQDGLCNNHVRNIVEDDWGNLWFGTSGGGISKYAGQQFIHFDKTNGLNGNYVYAITRSNDGKIWMSASNKGVTTYDGDNFEHIDKWFGFKDVKCKAIYADEKNRIWIGTEGEGLAIIDRDSFLYFGTDEGLQGNWIRDIIQDTLGRIWMATTEGISIVTENDSIRNNFSFQRYTRDNGELPSNRINMLHMDQLGRMWFATRSEGLGYFKNDTTIITIDEKNNLPDNAVRSLAEDQFGNLWIGTASRGICKIKLYENEGENLQVQTFSNQKNNERLTSDNVYLLLFDSNNNLWVGSEVGIDKVVLDAERNIKEVTHYGRSEGFVGIETCQNATLKNTNGDLWFGTINGLTKFNPKSTRNNTIAPLVRITNVQLGFEDLRNTKYEKWASPKGGILRGLKLPWNENEIAFAFQGINLSNPEKVSYQWKLEGLHNDWRGQTTRNFASFSNLSPGRYTFLVRAYNEDNVTNKEPAKTSFIIKAPFWQTWWFRLAAIVLLFSGIGFFIKNRIAKIERKAKRDKEKLELEKHLLSLEQKALQLQMNPHFIFNALNSIQALISQKDNKTARYQLAKFSKLMRSILENSRAQTIPLEDEIQTLENYLTIECSSRGNIFEFEVTTDENIDVEEVMIPPMMLQPFVENAIIHGVAHLSEKGKVTVLFARKNWTLECTISDNGIGRAKAKELKSQIDEQHKSAALEVTQERLDILNKDSAVGKSLDIIDLVNADGSAGGTQVVVRLPIFT